MKTNRLALLLALSLSGSSNAQEAMFFRVAGPVPSTIAAVDADGTLTWTNVATNATFTVQATRDLTSPCNWVDYVQVPVTNPSTRLQVYDPKRPSGMVLIPAGSFALGDSLDGDSSALPPHTVYVSAFYMDKYETTWARWESVSQWAIAHGYSFEFGAWGKAADHPAYAMTWYNAVKWCNARSETEGRAPAYYTNAAQTAVYRAGQVNVQNDWVKWSAGYRLPTEAEWEKAPRGGTSGHRFSWSDVNTITHGQANYYSDSYWRYDISATRRYHPAFNDGYMPCTSPVGYFAPNGYGLYDMTGNVWEWCWDRFDAYSSASQNDPRGPTSGPYRVYRGGSWHFYALHCRAANRGRTWPDDRLDDVGFRSILPLDQP